MSKPGFIRIAERFSDFSGAMKDVWASYLFIFHCMTDAHIRVKKGEMSPFCLESLSGKNHSIHPKTANFTFGLVSHVSARVNPERAFIAAVALTEDVLKDVTTIVYSDFPGKLNTSTENLEREAKLLTVILENDTKAEMLARIIEERVRSIFYGNPTEFFTKDKKVRLELGSYFTDRHSRNLTHFAEIIARRNILAHNGGRVDSKYLREVKDAEFTFGQKVSVDKEYLRHSIIVLRGLAAIASLKIIQNVYKRTAKGRVGRVFKTFDTYYNDSVSEQQRTFAPAGPSAGSIADASLHAGGDPMKNAITPDEVVAANSETGVPFSAGESDC